MRVNLNRTGGPQPTVDRDDVDRPTSWWRQAAALVLAAAVVVATGWWWGQAVVSVLHRPGDTRYPADLGSAQWIGTATHDARIYCRTAFDLETVPDRATLWTDATADIRVFVNGHQRAATLPRTRTGTPVATELTDLTAQLRAGSNAVTLQATNRDTGAAAVRSLLRLTSGTNTTSSGTGRGWRCTSDPALMAPAGDLRFIDADYVADRWPAAAVVTGPGRPSPSLVPQSVASRGLDNGLIGAPDGGRDLVAVTDIELPSTPDDGWLRVAANGQCTVTLDGHVVWSGSGSAATDTGVLTLLQVGPYLHAGRTSLGVHVVAADHAVVYVDGSVSTGSSLVSVPPVSGWLNGVATVRAALEAQPSSPQTVAETWPQGLRQEVASPDRLAAPTWVWFGWPGASVLACLVAWLFAGLLARRRGSAWTDGLVTSATALLPAVAVLLGLRALDRWPVLTDGWPYRLWTVVPVGVLVVASLAVSVTLACRPGRLRRVRTRRALTRWVTRPVTWVAAIAVTGTALTVYGISYEPLWQDELTSVIVAQSTSQHIVPLLPSGLLYFKAELYHSMLGWWGSAFGWDAVPLRLFSTVFYAAGVFAFGRLLMPTFVPGRPVVQVVATAAFALCPAELAWAGEVRMYQQAQFFVILAVTLLYRALREPTSRRVVAATASLLAMYFSHEETFVLLPAMALVCALGARSGWWRLRAARWCGAVSAVLIGSQYALTKIHPPAFGADLSSKPYVMFDSSQADFYYTSTYFKLATTTGTLMVVSSLAVVCAVVGVARRSRRRVYLGTVLWLTVVVMSLLFTAKVDRYAFITLPVLFVSAALGAVDLGDGVRALVVRSTSLRSSISVRRSLVAASVVGALAVAVSLTGGPRDQGLAAARLAGVPYGHRYVDYDVAAAYVRDHAAPGDLFITLCPPDIPAYYLDRRPDYIIQTGRNKLLYLIERDGRATDTIIGSPVILTADDLDRVMARGHRIWLVTDQGSYFSSVPPEITRLILARFTEVEEGTRSAVYSWGA